MNIRYFLENVPFFIVRKDPLAKMAKEDYLQKSLAISGKYQSQTI